jgi:hypothetical protein
MRGAAVIVFLALACDGAGGPKADEKAGGPKADENAGGAGSDSKQVGAATPAHAFPASAPPMRTCQVDADCTVAVDAAVGSDPCCNVTVTALPISAHYVRFMENWQKQNCAGVSCPPMALPGAQTAPCGMRGRCDSGTCNNSCGLAPDGGIGAPAPPP